MPNAKVEFFGTPTFLPVKKIHTAPWNFKLEGDDDLNARFDESLQRGKITPLHVATCAESKSVPKRIEACDGNHRVLRLRHLGVTRVAVWNHGELTLAQRQEVAMRYNGAWFPLHTGNLNEVIKNLSDVLPEAFEGLALTAADIDHAMASLKVDTHTAVFDDDEEEPLAEVQPKRVPEKQQKIKCPHCKKEFVVKGKQRK